MSLIMSAFIIFANIYNRRVTEIAVEKGTEETMRELELKVAELTATFNAVPDLLCIKDLDFVITECNQALLTHYGIRREDIIGTSTKQGVKDANYTDEEIEMYSGCDQRAIDERVPIINEEAIPRFDGTQPLFETIKAPIIVGDKVIGIVGVARDLTNRTERHKAELEREQAQAELAKVEKELLENQVLVMLSQIQPHFLYNALTAIARLCDKDPEQAKKATIEFAVYLRGNMNSLQEKEPIFFEKELHHVECYLNLEMAMYAEYLNIEYDIQTKNFRLPVLALQVLVENAIKHGVGKKKGGGTVKISASESESAFLIIVSDNGVGFDVTEIQNDGQTHIGINNVRHRLKEQCGGSLEIESETGIGTTATITIPKEAAKV